MATARRLSNIALPFFGKRRAPRGPEVGAGPRMPLGRNDVLRGCLERAPRGPPVAARPRVPLGLTDVKAVSREGAPRGP